MSESAGFAGQQVVPERDGNVVDVLVDSCFQSVFNSMTVRTTPLDVLVTGASGFIGGFLVRRLMAQGRRVRLLARNPDTLPPDLQQQCDVVQGDLANVDVLARAVAGVDVVYHCAANVNTWDRWEAYYQANVAGVQNLLDAIVLANPALKRLVHLSTVDVYGYPVHPCDETAEMSGAGFGYGKSKCMGEALVRRVGHERGIPYTIIRPTNVIGPGSQFIERMGHELRSGVMLIVDGGRANAGLVYVGNLVNYLVWAATADEAKGECYNVRDPYDVSWHQFIFALRAALAGRGIVIDLPYGLAHFLAKWCALPYRVFNLDGEPLLHPLLVRMFGRTCGHDASKAKSHSKLPDGVDFDQALTTSANWYLASCTRR